MVRNSPLSAPLLLRSLEREHDGDRSELRRGLDGVIEIEVEGASDPYTFAWTGPNEFTSEQQNLDSLSPGTYQLNLTDANGCAYPVTAFVPEVEPSDFTIGNDTIICEDEPLLIYGPLGYDYEWQDGSNNQFFYVSPGTLRPGRTASSSAERPIPVANSPMP